MNAAEKSLPTNSSRPTPPQEFLSAPGYINIPPSMQPYYVRGATMPPFFTSTIAPSVVHPYPWGTQHPMVSQYGTALPYPTAYAPSDIATVQHAAVTNSSTERKASDEKDQISMGIANKTSGDAVLTNQKSIESLKVASGSEHDGPSYSNGSACASSSQASDDNANEQAPSPTKKRSFNQLSSYGNGTVNSAAQHNCENPSARSMSNLNVERSNAYGASQQLAPLPMVACEGMPHEHVEYNEDEQEIKKERRKQSNRESARRSRLRKMIPVYSPESANMPAPELKEEEGAECEELQVKVNDLHNETRTLREELQRLAEECEKVACENNTITAELRDFYGPDVPSSLLVDSNDIVLCSVNGEPNGHSTECK